MGRFWIVLFKLFWEKSLSKKAVVWGIFPMIVLAGCGLHMTRNILPVAGPDETILPRTKGIAATKGDISVVVVPLPDVKQLDAFGVMIVNESPNWIYFKKEDCMLIQSGEVRYPVSDTEVSARLGSGYKPSMPSGLSMDISHNWGRPSVNMMRSRGLSIIDEEKRLSVMRGTKEKLFLYFKTRDDTSSMRFIISNMYNEATNQRTRFSFKFDVEKS